MVIPILHGGIVLSVYLLPFFVSWKLLLILLFLYYLQLVIVGNCVLTLWQFKGRSDVSFTHYLLEKMGFHIEKQKVRIATDYYIPWTLFAIAILWQEVL